jgi:hypothetical protein
MTRAYKHLIFQASHQLFARLASLGSQFWSPMPTNWQSNPYDGSSFPPPESTSNTNWNHTSSPGRGAPFQSRPNFVPQRRIDSSFSPRAHQQPYTYPRLGSVGRNDQAQTSWDIRHARQMPPQGRDAGRMSNKPLS